VRDGESKKRLELMGVTKPDIIITSDLAFLLWPRLSQKKLLEGISEKLNGCALRIGISIRPFDSMYNFFGVWNENILIQHIADLGDYLIQEYNASIIFVPMVVKQRCQEYHTYLEADDELSDRIIRRMKNKHNTVVINTDHAPEDILGLLSKMELVIGTRLHSLVLATRVGVPVIAIEYAPKIEAFMRSINRSEYTLNINELYGQKLQDLCDRALKEKDVVESVEIKGHIAKAEINKREIERMLVGTRKKYWRSFLFLPSFVILALLNYSYSWAHKVREITEKLSGKRQ
jgi:polysaccharide pyruvyl transferase WcaK-like protein